MATAARFVRMSIATAGVLAATAVAALPFVAPVPGAGFGRGAPIPHLLSTSPAAGKGDRLRTIFDACDRTGSRAACADIYGVANGLSATVVIERRIDPTTSVLVRFQAPDVVGH